MRAILLLNFLISVIFMATGIAGQSKTMPAVEYDISTGGEKLPQGSALPYQPDMITDSPGIIVGYTIYDQQTNGSTGNRIAICNDGSKYFCWTSLLESPLPPAQRHVYFNYVDSDGNWYLPEEGGRVDNAESAGYTTLDVIYGIRSAITYNATYPAELTRVTVSVDSDPPGTGYFDHYTPPNELFPQSPDSPGQLYWPYIAVGRDNNIHIVANEDTDRRMFRLGYMHSVDGGLTWTDAATVDTAMVIGSVIDTSPVSNRAVIAFAKACDTTSQWTNDIAYYVSDDGLNWDFENGVINVTNYTSDADSLWAYTDLDVIIDYDDYVHVIWNAQWVTDAGIYFRTYLFHYSEETGEITEICHHPESAYMSIFGAWGRPICKMNLGIHEIPGGPDGIFATWTQFDTSDVSDGGYGNGDIYMAYSADGGSNWSEPLNLTDTQTPDCAAGDCDSDHWSSLADVVDDSLHIIYINDKDAGSFSKYEGEATLNPVRYLAYPNPLTTSIEDADYSLPTGFSLNQNYPNPFNASTNISFSLKDNSPVKLEVFDITGSLVEMLIDRFMPPGKHDIIWNAENAASGVYLFKLTSGENTSVKKAVLVK